MPKYFPHRHVANRSPAKAGVQQAWCVVAWTPAFAGEHCRPQSARH